MDIREYEDWTSEVWKGYKTDRQDWDDVDRELNYTLAALGGEAGEVLNDWKKYIAGRCTKQEIRSKLLDELGDVLYYIVRASSAIGVSIEDVAAFNHDKLVQRHNRRSAK